MLRIGFFLTLLLFGTIAHAQLARIFFEVDDDRLDVQDRERLSSLVRSVKRDSGFILIEGYSDSTGNTAYNLALSERRARSVESYLNLLGIHDDKIRVAFYGEGDELPDHLGYGDLHVFRRVDVRFLPFVRDREYGPNEQAIESVVVQKLLEPKVQYIRFNNRYKRKILGNQGTFITLERLILKSKRKERYRDEILLELREFSRPTHFLHAGIHTSIGSLHLEIGGMAYAIARTPDGEVLRLNKRDDMLMGFPTDTLKDGMQVFMTPTDRKGRLRWRSSRRSQREYIEIGEGRVYRETRSKRDAFITMGIESHKPKDPNAIPLYESTIDGFGYMIFARPYTPKETTTLMVELGGQSTNGIKGVLFLKDERVMIQGRQDSLGGTLIFERVPVDRAMELVLLDLSKTFATGHQESLRVSSDTASMQVNLQPFTSNALRRIEGIWPPMVIGKAARSERP